ncbi:Flavodoxin [Clostridium bornimense]|uniref:Flavodoxin n=1 Tax=Clostridium bornimense TaxID=1216932 RepID=W6S7E4_9CLOT|nr:flavodoxin [Clostridium bornimense]CDM70332.1 Flavodoxin [Clostridium bornimense]
MSKIVIAFWSQTGNTESMANAIGEGVVSEGKKVEVLNISEISPEDLNDVQAFALGCPAMGVDELEECEMEPFVEKVEKISSGKTIALFGSYGWGEGQWMRDWEDRMTAAGAKVLDGEGLICQEMPDESVLEECRNLGKQLALI